MTHKELATKLQELIYAGKLDRYLEAIYATIRDRQDYLRRVEAQRKMNDLVPGTRVQIVGNIKPQYLNGLEGEVVTLPDTIKRKRRDFIMVRLDMVPSRRFGQTLAIPPSCLQRSTSKPPKPGDKRILPR